MSDGQTPVYLTGKSANLDLHGHLLETIAGEQVLLPADSVLSSAPSDLKYEGGLTRIKLRPGTQVWYRVNVEELPRLAGRVFGLDTVTDSFPKYKDDNGCEFKSLDDNSNSTI